MNYYKSKNREKLKWIYKTFFKHTLNIKFILIGGTNGKGTTANVLQQLLLTKFKLVGIFTSPHLCHVNERIRINKDYIDNNTLQTIIDKYIDIFIKYKLSFYEIIFFVSLEYFAMNQVDYAILEIGIGGQFDACNIVNPEISIITNVALDHVKILGCRISEIATTKAYIARPNKKLVLGSSIQNQALQSIVSVAKQKKAKISRVSNLKSLVYQSFFLFSYKALPNYFKKNVVLAIHIAIVLKIPKLKIAKTLSKELLIPWGRQNHFVCNKTNILVDGAHNPHGIKALVKSLDGNNWSVIFASKCDKDYYRSLKLLQNSNRIKKIYLASFVDGMQWNQDISNNLNCIIIGSKWRELFKKLILNHEERILFCGSLYFVGEIYDFFQINSQTMNPFVYTPIKKIIHIDENSLINSFNDSKEKSF